MRLEICFLENFSYKSTCNKVPAVLEITTDADIEIANKIDLKSVFLTNKENDNIYFGFSQNILSAPKETFVLKSDTPHLMMIDFLSDDRDFEEFKSGVYEASAQLKVYEKLKDGKFAERILECKKELMIPFVIF